MTMGGISMDQRRVRSFAFLASGFLLLGACAPIITEEPVQLSLAPMEKPEGRPVGSVRVLLLNGEEELRSEVVARDSETISFRDSDGCSYTMPTTGFAPLLTADNCGGTSGSQKVALETDSPWPLSVGKKWRYSMVGSNSKGDTWRAERKCEVKSEARVTAPLGTFDTYKVVCIDPARTRTYYVVPDTGQVVIFLRHDRRRNKTDRYELIRTEGETT